MDFSIPKLSSNDSLQPYVHEQDNVVTVDGLRIIDPQQKDTSNFDPIELKGLSSSSKRVSPSTSSPEQKTHCYEEEYPNASALDAASPTRIGLRCTNESFIIFIVTLSILYKTKSITQPAAY